MNKAKPGSYVAKEARGAATGVLTIAALVVGLVFVGPGLARAVGSEAVDQMGEGAADLADNSGNLAAHLAPLTAFGDGPYGPGGRYPNTPPAPKSAPTTAWTTPPPPADDGVKGRIRAIEPGAEGYPGAPEDVKPTTGPRGGLPSIGETQGGILGALPVVGGAIKAIGPAAVKALNP